MRGDRGEDREGCGGEGAPDVFNLLIEEHSHQQ